MNAMQSQARGRVLVVDDSLVNRRLLQRALGVEGYDAELAEDGRAGARRVADRRAAAGRRGAARHPDAQSRRLRDAVRDQGRSRAPPPAGDHDHRRRRDGERGAVHRTGGDGLPAEALQRRGAAREDRRIARGKAAPRPGTGVPGAGRASDDAAAAVESGTFAIERLESVAARTDALGSLARVFQRMADEVRAREARLHQQVRELRIVIDEERQAKKVAEITESDYFLRLRNQAADLAGYWE